MKCKHLRIFNGSKVNCGKCVACRVNDTSQKAVRALYEYTLNPQASFITLTYNDENLPKDFSLKPKDLTNFWKELRINLQRKYHEFAPKIKYIACGEYGDTQQIYYSPGAIKPHGRPHYHAIVYGLDNYNDEHREILRQSWSKCEPWFFDKNRGRNSGMQNVTEDDIRYVCGYTQKKLSGEMAKEIYGEALQPFGRFSQGLGFEFAQENKERLLENGFTVLKGKKIAIPRYFLKKWDVKASDLVKGDVTTERQRLEMCNDNALEDFQNEWHDWRQFKHMRGKL